MNDTTVSPASHPRRAPFDLLATGFLIGAIALAAVLFIPSSTIPFVFSKVAVLALGTILALAAFILARLTRGNIVVPPLTLLGALWLVPAAYLLSSLFSGGGVVDSILGNELETDTFAFVLLLSVIASLGALAFRRGSQYRIIFKAGALLALIVLAAQLLFFVMGITAPEQYSSTMNLIGSFTDLGMFVGLGVITSLLALRFLPLVARPRALAWSILGVGLFILAVVNSTQVWILVALTAFALFIDAILRRHGLPVDEDLDGVEEYQGGSVAHGASGSTESLAPSLIVLLISLFCLIGGQTIGAGLTSSMNASYLDVRPSWESTFIVGSHSFAASPLFGSGPGTFGEEWLRFRDRSINDSIFWNIDFVTGIGYIPTSFITTGIIGSLAWIAFLGLFWYVGIRALLFRMPEDSYVRFASVASFIGATYVFLLAIFGVPGPIILALGFLSAGIFMSTLRYAGQRREWGIIFTRNPRVGFAIVFILTILLLSSVVGAYTVIERYIASIAYAQGVNALSVGSLDEADAAAQRSALHAQSDSAYQLAARTGIVRMQRIANDTTLSPSQAQEQFQSALSGSIEAAKAAVALDQRDYQNWMVLGDVYQTVVPLKIAGAYENAQEAYAQAAILNPSSPSIPYVQAQLDVAQGNPAAAEEDLIKAITLKRDYAEAIFLLSQVQVQQGKAKEALQTAEAAAYFAPNDPNVLFQVGILRSGTGDQANAAGALLRAIELNPQFANARFFLAVVYMAQGNPAAALEQLRAVAGISPENATAVAPYVQAIQAGTNPFPQQALGALGLPASAVTEPSNASGTQRP